MNQPDHVALVVVEVQQGFDAESWGPRNNPECESNIAELIAAWRDAARPVVFVRHDSREQGPPLSPDSRGNAFKEVITGEPDLLVAKSVHSAFLGSPDPAAWLREQGCDGIAVCDITGSHCCETTARAGSDIGPLRTTDSSDVAETTDFCCTRESRRKLVDRPYARGSSGAGAHALGLEALARA